MSQVMNQGTNSGSQAEAPMKRKRGRPRKDENQAPPKPPVLSMQGEGSSAPKPTASISSKDKDSIEDVDDDDHNNDKMVGQVVTGVLEYAFDAGYFLTVRVGDSNMCMRGVVFKEGCVVPITPENDIAPNAKMYKTRDIPIPLMKFNPQIAQTLGNSSLNPMENIEHQQPQEKVLSENVTQDHDLLPKGQQNDKEKQENSLEEQQEKLSNDKEQQQKLSNDKQQRLSDDDKEQQENLSDDKEQQEKECLKDSSEPPLKFQKTDQTTVSFINEGQTEHSSVADENIKDAVKSDEAANATVVSKEVTIISPETLFSVKNDSPVNIPTVMEQEFHGTSGFQITMENDEDDHL